MNKYQFFANSTHCQYPSSYLLCPFHTSSFCKLAEKFSRERPPWSLRSHYNYTTLSEAQVCLSLGVSRSNRTAAHWWLCLLRSKKCLQCWRTESCSSSPGPGSRCLGEWCARSPGGGNARGGRCPRYSGAEVWCSPARWQWRSLGYQGNAHGSLVLCLRCRLRLSYVRTWSVWGDVTAGISGE